MEIIATNVTPRRRNVVERFVAFDNDDEGIPTEAKGSATLFFLTSDGLLTTDNGMFVGSQTGASDSQLRKFNNIPNGFRAWSFPSGQAEVQGSQGFCLISNKIYVVIDAQACQFPITLVQAGRLNNIVTWAR
jgi:hypothetical protein